MTKSPKSFNPLTSYERGEIWAEIEILACNLYQKGACQQNLSELNNNLCELNKLSKRLQRAQVGEALKKINA